jgi:uncharacterized protein (DUF2252 family)
VAIPTPVARPAANAVEVSSFVAGARKASSSREDAQTVRSPKVAVRFIEDFNQALGLSGKALSGKNAKLVDSGFGFFRGMPALFNADVKGPFAQASVLFDRPAPPGLLDGDPHLSNFGTLRGPDGQPVWGLNDFDQSGTGPLEWDLERLATSAVLAARANGLPPEAQTQLVRDVAQGYFSALNGYAQTGVRPPAVLSEKDASGPVRAQLDEAATATQEALLKPLTHTNKDGELRFKGKGLDPVGKKDSKALASALASYAATLPADAKVAQPLQVLDLATESGKGGSSFGLQRFLALVADADPSQPPHVLELKQEMPSAVADGTGDLSHADAAADVAHQATLSGFLDPQVGAVTLHHGSYLVRELQPEGVGTKTDGMDFAALDSLASQAGQALAQAHAQSVDSAAVGTWLGADQRAATDNLVAFAETYANQTEADRSAFEKSL